MKRKLLISLLIATMGLFCWQSYKTYDTWTFNSSIVMIQDLVSPIVRITGEGPRGEWKGSGVIVWSKQNIYGTYDSLVLTNNHCVEVEPGVYAVKYIEVLQEDGKFKQVKGLVLHQSNNNEFGPSIDNPILTKEPAGQDLALVFINTEKPVVVAKLMTRAQLKDISLFDEVIAVGCSLGGPPRLTKGQLTIIDKEYISINALFAPGSSGGAAYLQKGHYLIGITNANIPQFSWMGMCRPISNVYDWFDSIKYNFIYDNSSFNVVEKDCFNAVEQEINRLNERIHSLNRGLEKIADNPEFKG